ncbi:MAG: PDZ domain-containing protein, partial [Armatimonadota bacterium]|nr:PDZ domain-containing protein [Armatimonadota bacterium]
ELNPGNSGGPLVDLQGRVVGINEMQFGLGAAIPGNLARTIAEKLVANGKVTRAWIGLEVQPLLRSQPDLAGVLVSNAIPGSPAEDAGLEPGDILTSLGGSPVSVRFPEELPLFNQLVADLPIGKTVKAVLLRDGSPLTLDVRTEDRDIARPKEREFPEWGMTARNLALVEAKELRRDTRDGVLLTSLRSGGPCDDAKPKLVERDIIVAVDGKPVPRLKDLDEITRTLTADAHDLVPTVVTFDRGVERYLTVAEIGRKPLPQPAQEVRKAWIGISTQVLTRELAEALGLEGVTGVRITQVLPGTSADQAGLRVGDLIVALDGEEIPASRPQHQDLFPAMVRRYDIGAGAELTIIRDGARSAVPVLFQESPPAAREMKTYRDDVFDFAVRDLSMADRTSRKWQQDRSGVLVAAVSEGGWAALAHLAVGDVLVAVDGEPTPNADALESLMKRAATDKRTSVVLHAFRGIHAIYIELLPKWTDARP